MFASSGDGSASDGRFAQGPDSEGASIVLPLNRKTNARTIPTPSRTPRTTPIAISHQNTPVARLL
jgi:hypothetical protein